MRWESIIQAVEVAESVNKHTLPYPEPVTDPQGLPQRVLATGTYLLALLNW
jgi:hypothetical protein